MRVWNVNVNITVQCRQELFDKVYVKLFHGESRIYIEVHVNDFILGYVACSVNLVFLYKFLC